MRKKELVIRRVARMIKEGQFHTYDSPVFDSEDPNLKDPDNARKEAFARKDVEAELRKRREKSGQRIPD